MVFFGEAYDASGIYYALDLKTGEPVWTTSTYGNVWINATFDDERIYFGNMEGWFFAADPYTGEKLWEYNTAKDTPKEHLKPGERGGHGYPPGVYCNPVFQDGIVYTGSWAGYYFAFNGIDGKLQWRIRTQPDGIEGGLPDSSAPVLHKNYLYVQKGGWLIAAINIKTGQIDWEWSAPVGFLQNGTVTAVGDKIFGSIGDDITALPYNVSIIAFNDVENGGEELWRYQGGGGLTAAVATDDQLIFGSSGDVFITSLDPDTGEVLWRTFTGGMMLEVVPALYGDKVFTLVKNGYLYAIE